MAVDNGVDAAFYFDVGCRGCLLMMRLTLLMCSVFVIGVVVLRG